MKRYLYILYVLIFIGLVVYTFFVFKKQFSSDKSQIQNNNKNLQYDSNIKENNKDSITTKINQQENEDNNIDLQNAFDVTMKDCEMGCENIVNTKKKKYCQNFCGLAEEGGKNENCDDKKYLEKDYCVKNEAINMKDVSKCDTINDTGIKNQCINRIKEDTIDEMM